MPLTQSHTSLYLQEENKEPDKEEDEEEEDDTIMWTNIIFLPFYFWWELLMTIIVCMKCTFAPLIALYPSSFCNTDLYSLTGQIKFAYTYIGDTFYVIDVILHIVHRQVSDIAKRKEYLPKPTYLILFDILSLIPFFNLIAGYSCEKMKDAANVWPNILMFTELICIYRVAQLFLSFTHSYFKLMTGFIITVLIVTNAMTCLFLLMTYDGLCKNCRTGLYDWREYELSQIRFGNKTNTFQVHLFALTIIIARVVNFNSVEVIPHTYVEFMGELVILALMYFVRIFIVYPKMFSESVYRYKRKLTFHSRVKRIIAETKRRNPSSSDHLIVQQYYKLSWTRQSGINTMPNTINDLPSALKKIIYIDLIWPVFYHSPTLRKTSSSYQRWLSDKIELHRKQPHERFFEGPHCYTDLHYLKTGIVQIISAEDSKAPMISVTSGTLFGDISFYVPPKNRKVIVRCLTYCEIFTLSRADIVTSLYKFPEDSRVIMMAARQKVQHGRDLFHCKKSIRGIDRSEDEGIAYIKKRWWVINDAVQRWKLSSQHNKNKNKCEIPPEDEPYHCSKYIGQLVFCSNAKMRLKSMFTKENFPWILASHSTFAFFWNRFILVVAFISVIALPPCITLQPTQNSLLIRYFLMVIDIIYTADVIISLITAKEGLEHETRIQKVMVERFHSKYFILDVLAMFWIEYFVSIFLSHEKYQITARYCRLIKTYILFCDNYRYKKYWNKDHDLFKRMLFKAAMLYICSFYILPYVFYWFIRRTEGLNVVHTYGSICLEGDSCASVEKKNEELEKFGIFSLAMGYWFTGSFPASFVSKEKSKIYDFVLTSVTDILYHLILFVFLDGLCTAVFYLNYKQRVKYQVIASNVRNYYKLIRIHPFLMKRLNRFLSFYWKYFNGGDILYSQLLQDEPYVITWKLYDQVAVKLLEKSGVFKGAHPKLITELAHRSTFLMYPKGSFVVLFGIIVEDVSWLGSGVVMYEYQNENNEIVKQYIYSGKILSPSVFFEQPSPKTYVAATDCEIVSINRKYFFETFKKYPEEWYIFEEVKNELNPLFQDLAVKTFESENFQDAVKDRLKESRFTITSLKNTGIAKHKLAPIINYFKEFRSNPESSFVLHWRALIAFIVVVNVVSTSLQCAGNATKYNHLEKVKFYCDFILLADVLMKFTMPYYDERGIVISNIIKCTKHYLRRGFCVDVISIVFSHITLLGIIWTTWPLIIFKRIEIVAKGFHLYLLTGLLDYCADVPFLRSIFIIIIKWQLILILTAMGLAVFLVNMCIKYEVNANYDVTKISIYDKFCWISNVLDVNIKNESSTVQMKTIYMAALEYVETLFANEFVGHFQMFNSRLMVAMLSLFSSVVYRGFYYTCIVLLVLKYQTDSAYQDKINQLHKFLKAERIENSLIDKTINYFMYNWRRTQGANVLWKERIGAMLKQDMTYYFFKKPTKAWETLMYRSQHMWLDTRTSEFTPNATEYGRSQGQYIQPHVLAIVHCTFRTFRAANTLLGGGKTLERQLASTMKITFFPPNENIIREMDVSGHVYFVHRGKVAVFKEDIQLATLTKGSMFGLLDEDKPRAARTTVRSIEHADVLKIPIKVFQHFINDTIRKKITDNPQSKQDYLALEKPITEGPYNTITYILRGIKTIKLPFMDEPVTPQTSKWYEWWLLVVWVLNPTFNNILSFLSFSIFKEAQQTFIKVLFFYILLPGCDFLHGLFVVSEFFTMETVVIKNKCVQKYIRWKQLKNWERYLDLVSLIGSVSAFVFQKTKYGFTRVLRIYYIYKFSVEMSKTSKTKSRPVLLLTMTVLLLVTSVTGIWKQIACFSDAEKFAAVFPLFPEGFKFDKEEWKHPLARIKSCKVIKGQNNETKEIIFAVAADLHMDYVISLLYGVAIFVGFNDNFTMPISFKQVAVKVFLWYFLKLVSICLVSGAINTVHKKSLRKYQFDYQISTLIKYMKRNGISKFLQHLAGNYAERFWQRTEENWVPEIAHDAPLCLREDLFEALYMHHLLRPNLFHNLPKYILRQLVVRLQRTVIFPDQWIVKQGDADSVIYFIHEGDVEKWHTDSSGNTHLVTVLPSSNYFGLIPGLFPHTNFAFSYYSRTIVDCVCLHYNKWIDLINYYPEVKQDFYTKAKNLKM